MAIQHTVRLIPWDDREFVAAYQRAAADVQARGMRLDETRADLEIQRQLRLAGYPNAVCYCERTADDALHHRARCVVSRDGAAPTPLRR